ncbi:MAG: hypothetical protein WDN69_35415 [Aliidongia sp.]
MQASGSIRRLQPDEPGQQGVEALAVAGMEVDPADLLDQALDAFELLEAKRQVPDRGFPRRSAGRGLSRAGMPDPRPAAEAASPIRRPARRYPPQRKAGFTVSARRPGLAAGYAVTTETPARSRQW